MIKTFTAIAEANADHYNNHPRTHLAVLAVGTVGFVAMTHAVGRRMAKMSDRSYTGNGCYAK